MSTLFLSSFAMAKDAKAQYRYFTLEPEITTNFITQGTQLGYIKVKINLMVNQDDRLEMVQKHEPLILDAVIEVLNQESEANIKSTAGKEAIRQAMLAKINQILLEETGETVLNDLFFTQYLYQ